MARNSKPITNLLIPEEQNYADGHQRVKIPSLRELRALNSSASMTPVSQLPTPTGDEQGDAYHTIITEL